MIKLTRSIQITLLTVALLGGIVLGRGGWAVDGGFVVFACFLAAIVLLIKRRYAFGFLLVGVLALGIWRGNATIFEKTALGSRVDQTVVVTGRVADDPARNAKNRLVFTLSDVRLDDRSTQQNLKVQTGYKELRRGETVSVTGKIRPNLGSAPVQMGYGQVEVLSTDVGFIETLRQRFFAAVRTSLPDPMAGFGLGLLVGVRSLIDKSLQDTLSVVGLSHLVAVSGYNLTIIVQAAHRILKKVSLFTATASSLWLIFGFLLVAGFSASIVRAALVSTLALLTAYYGYSAKALTLVALPAAITAAYNPDYLMRDLGWQLSFLAFFGILVLAPLIENRLIKNSGTLKSIVLQSLCAQVMTFPLIMLKFGTLSIISPLANAAVLPLVPLAMLLCFGLGLIGMVFPLLASWLALPTAGLLGLMVALVQWFAGWHGASVGLSISPEFAVGIYGFILLIALALHGGSRRKRKSEISVLKDRIMA